MWPLKPTEFEGIDEAGFPSEPNGGVERRRADGGSRDGPGQAIMGNRGK